MFSFELSDTFLGQYKTKKPPFGFVDAAGNSVGEITFARTYARLKGDGSKERWWEVCARVINGTYSIQKNWCKSQHLPWDGRKAQRSAQEAYELLFNLKWSPPGRGLFAMGTPMVMAGNSAPLQNCAGISTGDMTKEDPGYPFAWCMSASMVGIGVGFDVKGAEKGFEIQDPGSSVQTHVISDSREGWAESVRLSINSYLVPNHPRMEFDYSLIRPRGALIKTFGGIAPGPEHLIEFHERVEKLFEGRAGQKITTLDIVDLMNMVGVAVISGDVRRSALLGLGSIADKSFVNAKDYSQFPYRSAWGWMSNNTVDVKIGDNLDSIVESIKLNGEPGVSWRDVTQAYGRLADAPNNKDRRAILWNPCSEQPLESGEMCTLGDVYISNCENEEEFHRAIKFAYLYSKTVTLVPTDWEKTNSIMMRNRRIGLSISGTTDFADRHGVNVLKQWMNDGYQHVKDWDYTYSEWLCVRESIKMTTSKPGGTTSLLAGTSAGCHSVKTTPW
jgi:ribonucleoside-triphosphate reductase